MNVFQHEPFINSFDLFTKCHNLLFLSTCAHREHNNDTKQNKNNYRLTVGTTGEKNRETLKPKLKNCSLNRLPLKLIEQNFKIILFPNGIILFNEKRKRLK